jgi:hypothetical protein
MIEIKIIVCQTLNQKCTYINVVLNWRMQLLGLGLPEDRDAQVPFIRITKDFLSE